VWHTGQVHCHYQVMGPGCFENRTALIHYERLYITEEQRQAKLARYRANNPNSMYDGYYASSAGCPIVPLELAPPPVRPPRVKQSKVQVRGEVHKVGGRSILPTWGASLAVEMPTDLWPGQQVHVDVQGVNQGWLFWQPVSGRWPDLYLSYHLRESGGGMILANGERTPVGQVVGPGEKCRFLASFTAPVGPGQYLVEWDMVSEFECWFAECMSKTTTVPVRVRSGK
jgi:hypothetical protein